MGKRRRLKNIEDVRRFLAFIINKTHAEEIDPSLASKLGYLCNILKGCIVDSNLEKRIEELEKQFAGHGICVTRSRTEEKPKG